MCLHLPDRLWIRHSGEAPAPRRRKRAGLYPAAAGCTVRRGLLQGKPGIRKGDKPGLEAKSNAQLKPEEETTVEMCPFCGERHLLVRRGEEFSRFVPGPELDLRMLEEGEKALAHPPCGWLVIKEAKSRATVAICGGRG